MPQVVVVRGTRDDRGQNGPQHRDGNEKTLGPRETRVNSGHEHVPVVTNSRQSQIRFVIISLLHPSVLMTTLFSFRFLFGSFFRLNRT